MKQVSIQIPLKALKQENIKIIIKFRLKISKTDQKPPN